MRIEGFFPISSRMMAAQEAPPGPRQARPMINSAPSRHRAARRSASSELTRRQHTGAFCIDREPARYLHEFKTTLRFALLQVRVR
jgi:hypothetical protein